MSQPLPDATFNNSVVTVTEEHLEYLDALRLTGATNMFGAGPYLMREFGVKRGEAHKILSVWMRTFAERHPRG